MLKTFGKTRIFRVATWNS